MKEQMDIFLLKLNEEKLELLRHARYMSEHNFKKEEEHIRTKITTIEAIQFELELVISGKRSANETKFMF